ncbi:MAG: hypothetical protein IEMM0006_0786 [bacterium]|nr:MAG: hypothetical protein IEMM0006_0786 [bacterium]
MKLVLLLATGIFFSSCNKIKNSDPYYKISDQFKQYCQFQKQSKWTYQNDSTKSLHSLTISDMSSYIGFHSPNNVAGAYSFDAVSMIYDTATDLNIAKSAINAGNPSTGSGKMHDLYWLFYKNGNYLLAFAPGFPMGVEQRLGNNPGIYTNLQKLSNFTLNGKDYTDVYHTAVKKTEGTPDTVRYQFYFAPHYGLIKWTRRVNGHVASYSLVQSNLIQK